MFWDAVAGAFKILTHWEIYAAGLEYLAIFMGPMAIAGLVMARKEDGDGMAIGCVSMLLMPVLQVAAMAVFVLTLSPIIFGLSTDAAWSFPWQVLIGMPWAFAKLVGVLVIAAIVLAVIPVLGYLQSLHTLVLGGIALVFVLGILESAYPGLVRGRVDVMPGFWFVVGLLIVGAVMSWIGMVVASVLASAMDVMKEGIGQLVMFPVAAVFGFIPVFIYGAWLGGQLRAGA